MPVATHDIGRELDQLAASSLSVEELMTLIVGRLKERLPHYDWVGFYMIETGKLPDEKDVLVLGPYIGAPTPHTRIPLDQGICGAAAATGETIVVDDVTSDPRYLACSVATKSEIVAPVRVNDRVVGELDIDSHTPAAFTAEDRRLVEHCAALVGRYLENISA
ncbi:MAG: GAF domain-containing protein [Acidobacteriota bacterium]|nr:GAF domain-containing protein [Acidobacteriota bacterium]